MTTLNFLCNLHIITFRMYRLCCKQVCLSKLDKICQFPVNYGFIMFYSTVPSCQKLAADLSQLLMYKLISLGANLSSPSFNKDLYNPCLSIHFPATFPPFSCHFPAIFLLFSRHFPAIFPRPVAEFEPWILVLRVKSSTHRHLSNIECLKALPACLVCFISTVNGHHKKTKKKPWKTGASSRHITNLKQSILDFRYLWFYHCFRLVDWKSKEHVAIVLIYIKKLNSNLKWWKQIKFIQTVQIASFG